LILLGRHGCVPLHGAAIYSNIQGFRSVFEAGIRYFPEKKGINLMFRKSYHHFDKYKTPIQSACRKYGCDKVMEIIEDTLGLDFQRERSLGGTNNNNNSTAGGPYNIVDALITAAIDEDVHLDCVYFLLRRHPDLLVKLLPSSESTAHVATVVAEIETKMVDSNSNNNGYDSKQRKRKGGG
jgi:hypothetical protein